MLLFLIQIDALISLYHCSVLFLLLYVSLSHIYNLNYVFTGATFECISTELAYIN